MRKLLLILFTAAMLNAPAQQVLQNDSSVTTPVKLPAYSKETSHPWDSSHQQMIYKLKPSVDLPIIGVGTAWSLYAFTKIYNKDTSSRETILSLNKNNIPGFDRWATKYYDPISWRSGNVFFYGAMPLPVVVALVDGKLRKDFVRLTLLYWETVALTGLLYTSSTYFIDRYRPYAYNPDVDLTTRMRGGAKNSFYAGHVALVSSSVFFTASVLANYHPNSRCKWLYYTLAGAATSAIAYKRLIAGQHFPSDILIGMAQGTLTGILVPKLHKSKFINQHVSIIPLIGDRTGMMVAFRF